MASLAHSNMTERQTCKRCYDDNVDTILEKAPTIILSLSEVVVCKDLDDKATSNVVDENVDTIFEKTATTMLSLPEIVVCKDLH